MSLFSSWHPQVFHHHHFLKCPSFPAMWKVTRQKCTCNKKYLHVWIMRIPCTAWKVIKVFFNRNYMWMRLEEFVCFDRKGGWGWGEREGEKRGGQVYWGKGRARWLTGAERVSGPAERSSEENHLSVSWLNSVQDTRLNELSRTCFSCLFFFLSPWFWQWSYTHFHNSFPSQTSRILTYSLT